MSDETSTSKGITRRELFKLGGAAFTGALAKTAADALHISEPGGGSSEKDIIQASESRRKNTPVVARMELVSEEGMDPNLRALIERGGSALTAIIDAPTDVVTLYVEKLRLSGQPIPSGIQTEITEAVNEYHTKIAEALAKIA